MLTAPRNVVYAVLNSDSEYWVLGVVQTFGLENDLSSPSSSRRLCSVAAQNSSRSLRLDVALIGVQDQRLLSSLHANILRLQTSITWARYSQIKRTVVGRSVMSQLHT